MKVVARLIAAVALGLPVAALASPSDYVHVPAVEYGEREIDFKTGTWQLRDEPVRESAASLGFGYGATQWWFTEAYIKYASVTGEGTKFDAFEWENKFQLTEHNQYLVDLGFLFEIEVPREHRTEGYELEFGPLVQGDAGPIRWNANAIFSHVLRGSTDVSHDTNLEYQLQAKYSVSGSSFEVGAQAFGELGTWNHWAPSSEQVHRLGPAIFGKVKLGEGREAIRYNAALLFPGNKASPKNGFRLQVEYEF